jgi:hypothetical protein
VLTSPGDVDMFKPDAEGALSADVPGPCLDVPPVSFDAALQVLRQRVAERDEYLRQQRGATGRLPTSEHI